MRSSSEVLRQRGIDGPTPLDESPPWDPTLPRVRANPRGTAAGLKGLPVPFPFALFQLQAGKASTCPRQTELSTGALGSKPTEFHGWLPLTSRFGTATVA